ncbi:MAG TPA: hypothetical protein DEB31_05855, partial [Clostridiales bacterium]|nr:hypothetical protein [Clostridiales bacterium]
MSKIKILETNKSLLANAQGIFDDILNMQARADEQIKSIRVIEAKIVDIEKAKKEKQAREEQQKAEAERQRQELAAQKEAEQVAKEAAPAPEDPASTAAEQETKEPAAVE